MTTELAVTDYPRIALDYARWAISRKAHGKVCKWVRLAAQRHIDDLARARKDKAWGYWFDDRLPEDDGPGGTAWDVCDFVGKLPHVEGRWDSPTIDLEPWQVFVLSVVFGWRRADGGRRFNTAYIELARKNGKSALSSGVALYCLCCEGEPGPQVKTAATTGDQARIVFDVAKKMVSRTPDLREAFSVEAMANSIPCWMNGGSIKPINAKASTQDGLNPHLTIIDELHAHADRSLFDVLKSARGARKNPLSWYITTAGYNVEGVCYEQRKLVCRILEGIIDADHYFGIIFTLDEDDDPLDPAVWSKSNPNLGVSVQEAEMAAYATEAKASPDSLTEFLTKRQNIWTQAAHGWVNIVAWKKCDGRVDLDALIGVPCWGGLDLASTADMTAFRLVWLVDGRLKTWGRTYLPEDAVRPRTERGNVPYQRWADQGLLTVTPGNVTDYEFIRRDVGLALSRFRVQEIGFDPWNAMDLVNRLVEDGAPMIEVRQTVGSLSGAMKDIERHYLGGTLDHGGDPILTWAVSNVVARRDANDNVAPDRKKSEEKIDPFAALVVADSRAIVKEGPPVYSLHVF